MIRKYEVVYIFDSALDETQVNQHLDRFHELLKTSKKHNPVSNLAHWGKRTLAYPIKNKDLGHYVVAHIETNAERLSEFERAIKLEESVLRHLMVINEGLPVTPAPPEAPRDDSAPLPSGAPAGAGNVEGDE